MKDGDDVRCKRDQSVVQIFQHKTEDEPVETNTYPFAPSYGGLHSCKLCAKRGCQQ